jgi:GNAT superfamily N-acetyltransferase
VAEKQSNAGRETGVRISTDPGDVDLDWLAPALAERAYWAIGRPREVIEASIRGSLCFGAFRAGRQVGFARVVTDQATFGWVCDVFVDETERGSGIGGRLIDAIVTDPRLQTCRLALASRDAGELYRRYGFVPLRNAERWMERPRPERRPSDRIRRP